MEQENNIIVSDPVQDSQQQQQQQQQRRQQPQPYRSVPAPKSVQMMLNQQQGTSSSSLPPPPPPPPPPHPSYQQQQGQQQGGGDYYQSHHQDSAPSYYSNNNNSNNNTNGLPLHQQAMMMHNSNHQFDHPHHHHHHHPHHHVHHSQHKPIMNGYSRRQQQQQNGQQSCDDLDAKNGSGNGTSGAAPPCIEVYGFNSVALYTIPRDDILSMPSLDDPSNSQIKNLQLCPNFDASRPSDDIASSSCVNGSNCKFVHAKLDNATRQEIHVNYAYATLDDVCYESFPRGDPDLHVAPPNGSVACDYLPAHLVLKTAALQSNRRVISHCAHYYFNRVCNRGPECFFIHAISLVPYDHPSGATVGLMELEQQDPSHPLYNYNRRTWGRTQTKKMAPANVPSGNGTGTTTPIPLPISMSGSGNNNFNINYNNNNNGGLDQYTSYGQHQQGGPLSAFAGVAIPSSGQNNNNNNNNNSPGYQTPGYFNNAAHHNGSYPLSRTDSSVYNKNLSGTPPSGIQGAAFPTTAQMGQFNAAYINNGGSTQNLAELDRQSDEDENGSNEENNNNNNNNHQQNSSNQPSTKHLSANNNNNSAGRGMPVQQLSSSNLSDMGVGIKKSASNVSTPFRKTHNPYSMTNPVVRSYNGSPVTPFPPANPVLGSS